VCVAEEGKNFWGAVAHGRAQPFFAAVEVWPALLVRNSLCEMAGRQRQSQGTAKPRSPADVGSKQQWGRGRHVGWSALPFDFLRSVIIDQSTCCQYSIAVTEILTIGRHAWQNRRLHGAESRSPVPSFYRRRPDHSSFCQGHLRCMTLRCWQPESLIFARSGDRAGKNLLQGRGADKGGGALQARHLSEAITEPGRSRRPR